MQNRFELPEPAAEARAHSRRVADRIREHMRAAGGWLDFAQFMELALYAPALGYYSAGSIKVGPAGDFVTAPEISPLFGRCLARSCLPWLRKNPGGIILELGAGTGVLAVELLTTLAGHGLPEVRYQILEVSADLRQRQQATLARLAPGHLECVEWLDELPGAPLRAIILANEVADALPVSRFVVRNGKPLACGVVEFREGFTWATRAPARELAAAVAGIERSTGGTWPEGFCSEICLRLPAWVHAIATALDSGVFLLCDYGMSRREYYHHERRDGTLTCHYRHRAHCDPFFYPGLQDITAWVDFTALAEAGEAAGLRVAGYGTQAHFLLDAGLDAELAACVTSDASTDLLAVQQAKKLLLPGEMGERFKVMALTRGDVDLPGFGFRDLRHLL